MVRRANAKSAVPPSGASVAVRPSWPERPIRRAPRSAERAEGRSVENGVAGRPNVDPRGLHGGKNTRERVVWQEGIGGGVWIGRSGQGGGGTVGQGSAESGGGAGPGPGLGRVGRWVRGAV